MRISGQVEAGQPVSTWLGFLSPEDVVVYHPPEELKAKLVKGFAAEADEPVFTAANRLALEAFRCGAPETATMVCHAEIRYAAARLADSPKPELALFGLQPVVNLVRLNGYVADLEFARAGLATLEAIAEGAVNEALGLTFESTAQARAFCRANCLIETAKILWRRGLYDELREQCARLMRKWPQAAEHGPFHSAEAAPPEHGTKARVLQRILRLRELSRSGAEEVAEELFATRDKASARERASLADSLYRMGDAARGRICFAEAHEAAAAFDPSLANLFRSRWLGYAGESAVPAVLAVERLRREEVEHLGAVAVERLRWR